MQSESTSRRRQIGLFLLVVILPSAVLIALGVQLVSQERALAEQQAIDERQLVVARARQVLLGTLEQVQREALDAITRDTLDVGSKAEVGPTVVLAARADGGVLHLPWSADRRAQRGRASLRAEPFVRRVAEATRAEFINGDPARAVALYEDILAAAQDSIQEAYASLALARALHAAGRRTDALSLNQRLLALPHHVTDEVGIPVALYAAARVLERGTGGREVIGKVDAILHERRWRSPTQAYMLRNLLGQAATTLDSAERRIAPEVEALVESEIAVIERTIDLQGALPGLGLPSGGTPESAFARQLDPLRRRLVGGERADERRWLGDRGGFHTRGH